MTDTFSAHPKSLKVFFATEMWERYGFYVVQSLLALYLVSDFSWNDKHIYELVGSFTALTYLSPIIGGIIADSYLGQKRTILCGTLVLCISYFILSIVKNQNTIEMTLAGIALGTGLLKPNISSLLGNLYPQNSPKRESGFTLFYMGIVLGIVLGTTLPSQILHHYGWSTAFLSGAVGMIFAMIAFSVGTKYYHIEDYIPYQFSLIKTIKALSLMLILWVSSMIILKYPFIANIVFIVSVVLAASYIYILSTTEKTKQAKQTLVLGLLCLVSILFWAFYFQMFLSLTLFIKRVVVPTFAGVAFPAPYYVSIQSIGILIFGYFLTKKNKHLNLAQSGILSAKKFIIAICLMTACYALIVTICLTHASDALLSPLYIIPAYLFISLAELLLSPVGLSVITLLANRRNVSTMMGIFFISLGCGAFIAGKLAIFTAITPGITDITIIKQTYTHGFSILLSILAVGNIICFGIYMLIKQLLMIYIDE